MTPGDALDALAAALGGRVQRSEPLAVHTNMRVGGPADLLIVCHTVEEVADAVRLARANGVPWRVLGGGCNVLVADAGMRGLVIINRAGRVQILEDGLVWAEAGASLSTLAQETVGRGLAGLEWAVGLPGTVGGAIIGNAGAFDGDIAAVLRRAAVLGANDKVVDRDAEWFEFDYRASRIKRQSGGERPVVLSATFALQPREPEALAARVAEILEWRRTRHPTGATMGSTFKNPPGSHAGYLIEQAGLRGHCIGGAQVSELHGNFFMNTGGATAADVVALVQYARSEVSQRFGVDIELEIELVGEW